MTLRLCKKGDSLWGEGSAANQIHDLAKYYKNHIPHGNRFEFAKTLENISVNARAIIQVVTHEKHPVDLHRRIISNLVIKNELSHLVNDLRNIAEKVEGALRFRLHIAWETSFDSTLRMHYSYERFDKQKYQTFKRDTLAQCVSFNKLADEITELLPMIIARIERGEDFAEEKSIHISVLDRASPKVTELIPLLA